MLEDVWVEEVYTAVDDVAHKRAGLFHVMQDLREQKTLQIKREQWDAGQAGRNGEGLQYLVCFLVFNDAPVVHGLLSVRLQKQTKKSQKRKKMHNMKYIKYLHPE